MGVADEARAWVAELLDASAITCGHIRQTGQQNSELFAREVGDMRIERQEDDLLVDRDLGRFAAVYVTLRLTTQVATKASIACPSLARFRRSARLAANEPRYKAMATRGGGVIGTAVFGTVPLSGDNVFADLRLKFAQLRGMPSKRDSMPC